MNRGTRGLFLDRDGTINEEVDFITTPSQLRLIEGVDQAIHSANELGFKVFIITNQSGVARGFLTEEKLQEVHNKLLEMLNARGSRIDAIYYCPHYPDEGNPPYKSSCSCRKPGTGMLEQAVSEYGIDLSKSYVVGDRMIDVQTGIAASTTSILVLTGYGQEELKLCKENHVPIDYVADDLSDAVGFISRHVATQETQTL